MAAGAEVRGKSVLRLCAVGHENGTASDQNHAEPAWQRKPFTQEEYREQCHEDDAELVDRSNARGIPELQGAEAVWSGKRPNEPQRSDQGSNRQRDGRYHVSKRCQRLSAFDQVVAVQRECGKGREAAADSDRQEDAR